MFIQPWDASTSEAEWRDWLGGIDPFGALAVNNLEPDEAPLVVPTHFTLDGDRVLLHLATPNPVWPHLERAEQVRLVVTGDYAYVPTYWRAASDIPEHHGVPTSYYASVQLVCRPTVIDDPTRKAEILAAQLADMQPERRYADVGADSEPYGKMLPAIRGIELEILHVDAKFKYDDHKPVEMREQVSENLRDRRRPLDPGAAAQQERRLREIGDRGPRPEYR